LLVSDTYTGGFIVTFPYYPELVHSLHYCTSCPVPLLMVASTNFSIPYSYLYRKYINHIHPLYFLPLPSIFHCALPLA
jgi:hypothetical protein